MVLCCILISCWHRREDINIEYTESKHYYSMDAWFHEYQTRDVEEFMDDKIGRRSNVSFVDTRMDGRVALDNRTTFFIKKVPGHIKIELDKRKNSAESYKEIKTMCEGIKEVLK